MVTTRRQSALGSSLNHAASGTLTVGNTTSEVPSTSASSTRAKSKVEHPAKKRRKTTKASSGTTSSRGKADAVKVQPRRGRQDLSVIMTMPLDIVYEILSQLTLSDLINLAQVNQPWRKILLATQATSVWRAARKAGACPEPPEDFTERRWANMLLGKACQYCGSTRQSWGWRDWLLLRIVCSACRRKHLVDKRTITGRRFPNINIDILNYVPHTGDSGWDHNRSKQFYWDEDIIRISGERDAIQDPEARRAWEAERAAAVEKRLEMVPKYRRWQYDVLEAQQREERKVREARLEAFKTRFVDAGYNRNDVDKSLHSWLPGIHAGSPKVSNAVWEKLRPKLEPRVQAQINARLAEELKHTVEERMKVLEGVYTSYLDSLRPSERLYYPPVEIFRQVPDLLELLEAPKETEVASENFQPFERNFGKYIADFQAKLKVSLNEAARQNMSASTTNPSFDLASVVFRRMQRRAVCCRSRGHSLSWTTPDIMIIVGWPMIGTHSTPHRSHEQLRGGVWIPMPAGFDFNRHASLLSAKLVKLAGLDSKTTTVAEMDARDPRFVHPAFMTETGYPVLTWRAALSLFDALRGSKLDSDESFRLATPEEEAQAKESEIPLRASAKAWSCNHCHEFLAASQAESKAVILEHLASRHNITEAKVFDDYFVNERCRHTYEAPSEIAVPDRGDELYRCLCVRCRQAVAQKRRFTWKELQEHCAWIDIPYPAMGRNYTLARTPVIGALA